MEEYGQFVNAAERKDAATLKRIICECPELHSHEGDDGSLLDILRDTFPEFIESAFAAGLHPDSGTQQPHQTLLQRAVCDNDLKLIGLCLANGAGIERRNCEGETALGYAAAWASLEVVEALLRAGADVNAIEGTAETGFSTAYDAACSTNPEHGRAEIRELLRAHGAKSYSELPANHQSKSMKLIGPPPARRPTHYEFHTSIRLKLMSEGDSTGLLGH